VNIPFVEEASCGTTEAWRAVTWKPSQSGSKRFWTKTTCNTASPRSANLGDHIAQECVPIVQPPAGHAIYIDARAMLPHIPSLEYPGQALAMELYRQAGIRSCEIGSVMHSEKHTETGEEEPSVMELVRLAIPHRVYTQSQYRLRGGSDP
jgi:hypothetical protein